MSPKKLLAFMEASNGQKSTTPGSVQHEESSSSSSSEENSDSSTDHESDDNSSSSESEYDISMTQVECEKPKQKDMAKPRTSDIRLSCLHEWDEDKLLSQFKRHLQEREQLQEESSSEANEGSYRTTVEIGGPLAKDFIPWWEEFTKAKSRSRPGSSIKDTNRKTDSDHYESWFSKADNSGTNWLAGSGTTSASSSQQVSKVEDIEVPSIYDAKPQPKGRRALKRERRAEREKTLGKKWFEMKAPDVDEKIKNDMELIRMRGVLDPKRFYKHHDRKGLPKYFQMGTVVDEGTDFYSSRLSKKQRKQTLVEELMADANVRQYNKRKYGELQQKMRGKKKVRSKKS